VSTEHREMRPFESVSLLDGFVESTRLLIGDSVIEPGSTRAVDADVYLHAGVALKLADSIDDVTDFISQLDTDETMRELDLSVDELELVIIATSSFLKIMDIVARYPLRELSKRSLMVDVGGDPRRDSLLSPNAGCEIDTMVCLSRQKSKVALRPWRKGTWISRATFALTTEQALTGFTPRPMDAEKKTSLGIPVSTARYITLSTSPLELDTSEDDVEMWVDADLLAQMSAMPKSKGSLALQRQLFIDAVSAIVVAAMRSEGDEDVPTLRTCTWPDIEKSLLGRVIGAMAPPSRDEAERVANRSRYLEILRSDPARFLAYAEERAGVSKSFNELVEV